MFKFVSSSQKQPAQYLIVLVSNLKCLSFFSTQTSTF